MQTLDTSIEKGARLTAAGDQETRRRHLLEGRLWVKLGGNEGTSRQAAKISPLAAGEAVYQAQSRVHRTQTASNEMHPFLRQNDLPARERFQPISAKHM